MRKQSFLDGGQNSRRIGTVVFGRHVEFPHPSVNTVPSELYSTVTEWFRKHWTGGMKNFLDRASLLILGSANETCSLHMVNRSIHCSLPILGGRGVVAA